MAKKRDALTVRTTEQTIRLDILNAVSNAQGSVEQLKLAKLALDFAAKNLKPFGFSFIQIDDHWQLGTRQGSSPKKNFSAADPKGPYPSGMKATVQVSPA